jgi:GTP-binding protein HflX
VSALTGQGMDQLKKLMCDCVSEIQEDVELYFPRTDEHRIFDLSRDTKIVKKEPGSEGTICVVQMTPSMISKWKEYLVK